MNKENRIKIHTTEKLNWSGNGTLRRVVFEEDEEYGVAYPIAVKRQPTSKLQHAYQPKEKRWNKRKTISSKRRAWNSVRYHKLKSQQKTRV